MLTIKQVAERLSVSLSLAYRLVRTGEIESYRIGNNCRRVSEEQLRHYLQCREVTSQQTLPSAKGRHF
jgi:excisionase family DNA binding protein